jgi:hypothetical protein
MNLEASTTEVLLHNDRRLFGAVQAVIEYASEHAHLSESARGEVENAASEASEEAFRLSSRNGNTDPVVRMVITGFPDRVEIAIEHRGDSPVGQHLKNVDRIDSKVQDGVSRTTLVKFGVASKSEHRG